MAGAFSYAHFLERTHMDGYEKILKLIREAGCCSARIAGRHCAGTRYIKRKSSGGAAPTLKRGRKRARG